MNSLSLQADEYFITDTGVVLGHQTRGEGTADTVFNVLPVQSSIGTVPYSLTSAYTTAIATNGTVQGRVAQEAQVRSWLTLVAQHEESYRSARAWADVYLGGTSTGVGVSDTMPIDYRNSLGVKRPLATVSLRRDTLRRAPDVLGIATDGYAVNAVGLPIGYIYDALGQKLIVANSGEAGTRPFFLGAVNQHGVNYEEIAFSVYSPSVGSLPNPVNAQQGAALSLALTANNRPTGVVLVTGLPLGTSFTGLSLSGTPTESGEFTPSYTIKGTEDLHGTLTLSIAPQPIPVVAPSSAIYPAYAPINVPIVATQHPQLYAVSPTSLSVQGSSVVGALYTEGSYHFTVAAQNYGGTGYGSMSIIVTPRIPVVPYNVARANDGAASLLSCGTWYLVP